MPGPFVTLGCSVMLTPGAAGPPDMGVIMVIPQATLTMGGQPVAVTGSICLMTNTVSGAPYPLPIGSLGSSGVSIGGRKAVRLGDQIPTPPGIMAILGPPAGTYAIDGNPP
jgi:uncharacterized Zn-binding protein involved in type VI secretion